MRSRWIRRTSMLGLSLPLSLLLSVPALSQSAASLGAWAGWARCEVDVTGQGYTDRQTHLWTMSGAPTVQGAFRIYPGTWSVVGGGSLQRTQGKQTLAAQWATNVPSMSAPLALFVRASDRRMFIQSRHTQLRAKNAIQGFQQQTVDGKAKPAEAIGLEAFEWAFPTIDVTPRRTVGSVVQPASANGSATQPARGSVGPMQPAGAQTTAACTWQFGEDAAAPEPSPPLTARAVPVAPP
jgi:hypothetical protein